MHLVRHARLFGFAYLKKLGLQLSIRLLRRRQDFIAIASLGIHEDKGPRLQGVTAGLGDICICGAEECQLLNVACI